MSSSYLKSDDFHAKLGSFGRSPKERLIGLAKIISDLNQSKVLGKDVHNKIVLSITDINNLRELIKIEVCRTNIKNLDIVTDQILFLIVGASKLHLQSKSPKSWESVYLSIDNFIKPDKSNVIKFASLCVLSSLIVILFFNNPFNSQPRKSIDELGLDKKNSNAPVLLSQAGTKTVDQLISIFNQMKQGDCQIPQAAMLQENDRQIFLAFINNGIVDINTAERLKNALSYVSCGYPQKAMKSAN